MDISDDLEKALFVVSKFKKSLGKLGVVGKALSKVVSQVKRLIQTIKNIIDIVAKCGAFAILGILFSLAALYFSLKISAVITAGAAAVGTALCGPICGGAFLLTAAVTIVAKINEVYGQITDDIIGGCGART